MIGSSSYSTKPAGAGVVLLWVRGMADQTIALSIYLFRPDRITAFEKALHVGLNGLPLTRPLDGYAINLQASARVPSWVPIIQSILKDPGAFSLIGQSPAAMLVIRRAGKTFVLTFGHAWAKLDDDWLEPDFGRRVALNLIPPDKLVEIHIEQVFAKWHIARERAPRASSVEEFGVQFDRDLVASVEGEPSKPAFGKKLRGGTYLRVDIPFSELPDILDESVPLFQSDAYKKDWPEIDNINVVTDELLIEKLEAQFDVELKAGNAQKKLVMFAPTYRREEAWAVDSYVFGRMSKSPATTPYLLVQSWMNFLAKIKREPSVAAAKDSWIHLMDETKEPLSRCTAFQCFGFELPLANKQYILSSGIWYEVAVDFLNKVNRAANKIPAPLTVLPPWNQVESEGEYNLRCGQTKGFLSFDAKNIMYGGGQSKFEFCDVLHMTSRTLFFAKIATKSSGMSHLVEQVRRTTELLFTADGEYRKELVQVFKKYHKSADTEWLKTRPRHGDWNICLVSLGKTPAELPFFARCSLVKVYNDLREGGHEVSFLKV
jgi:uncharacterized protein (TIGR04141 family)